MTGEQIEGMHLQKTTRHKRGAISFDGELLTKTPMTERGSLISASVREDNNALHHATFSLSQETLTTTHRTSNNTHSEYVSALSKDRQATPSDELLVAQPTRHR